MSVKTSSYTHCVLKARAQLFSAFQWSTIASFKSFWAIETMTVRWNLHVITIICYSSQWTEEIWSTTLCHFVPPWPVPVMVTVFCPLWWVVPLESRTDHRMGSLEHIFAALSERFNSKTKDNKEFICTSGVQAFEFRDTFEIDAEICELWSIEWRCVLRRVVGVCNLCFALYHLGRTRIQP